VDFPLQNKFQWSNKGTYLHPGGILHAALHGIGTFICLYWSAPLVAIQLAIVDAVVHYHIDWAKMNINKKLGWGPTTDEQFWWLLGFDQWLHAITYIAIVSYLIGGK
jgi:hypothetical protein